MANRRNGEAIRLSPADGIALSRDQYDLRAWDGALICKVAREKAEAGINDGSLKLVNSPSGVHLIPRSVYSTANRVTGAGRKRRTWIGAVPEGEGPACYAHDAVVCDGFRSRTSGTGRKS